jgi:hypothetical protein
MSDLNFFYDDNTVFTDASQEMRDYLRDELALTFVSAEDALYYGLYKPLNTVFAEFTTAAGSDPALTFEYSNGSGFSSLTVTDDTKGFTRSGFINWEKPSEWAAQSVNGTELFWIKITAGTDFTATLKGFNLVFADDNDLSIETRTISDLIAQGDTTFISYHVAARNEIVQTLRNGGHVKQASSVSNLQDVNQWDVLIPEQLRNAAKYLALSKIMFDVSSNTEDKWYQKFKDYRGNFSESFKLYLMAIDTDDDGEDDAIETNRYRTVEFIKV